MSERLEAALDMVAALACLALFAMAFGLAMDNHAARLDPASQYHATR